MNRRVQVILLAALAAMLLMTILPPVTTMSYDYSGRITKVSPVTHYELLFARSGMEINYPRLFLQYLVVAIAGAGLVLSQRKVSVSLAAQVAELSDTNDKLRENITKGKHAWEQLRQKAVELTAAKEKLICQINQLRDAEQKWYAYRDQLEQHLNERVSELGRANEQLQYKTGKLEEVEECFNRQAAELAVVKEQLQQQTRERENFERQLCEYSKQLEQRVEQRTAELTLANTRLQDEVGKYKQTEEKLTAANEQLQREIAEHRQLEESLGRQIADLTSANEKIQTEADKCKILEKQFLEYRQQYNNERLQEKMDESEPLAQSDGRLEQSEIHSDLFNVKKMKALAELAKRLSDK